MEFTVLNWNIGGEKYLMLEENQREDFRNNLNYELKKLIRLYEPHVVSLQEIVRYGNSPQNAKDIIDPINDYSYYAIPLINSDLLSSSAKWDKARRLGGWTQDTFFAQGSAMLIHKDLQHFPIWDLSASNKFRTTEERHFIERVNLDFGLFLGNRNTEPRAALVAHFICHPKGEKEKPVDIFLINLHLTTYMMEGEGIPEIDLKASDIRLKQLDIVFRGIVSRYNIWRAKGYSESGLRRAPNEGETFLRYPPVWILAGTFNFTPESVEYETIMRMNFIDCIYNKGSGTKAKGSGEPPTLTLDYVFAGPKFISLSPVITKAAIRNNHVNSEVRSSNHYPIFAKIPLAIPGMITELQEKAKTLFKTTENTPLEELGRDVNSAGAELLDASDPTRLEKAMGNLQKVLAAIYSKISDDERGEVWELLKQANDEEGVVDKINLINIVVGIIVGKISSQLGKVNESKTIIVEQHGHQSGVYIESENKAVNISGDLSNDLENLKTRIEMDYDKQDKNELLQTINHMKKSCDDPSKKNWLKEKLRGVITKTSEISSISSLAIALLKQL